MRPLKSFVAQPIRSLQTMLRVIATDEGKSTSVIPDGIYGTQTMAAVTDFQRSRGLPVTGVTDQRTWERIVEDFNPARTRVIPAHSIDVVLNPGQVIHKNEYHPNVYLAQGMLITLSKVYGSISQPGMTGVIDLPTSHSLETFQLLNELPMTGELDKITWKNLALHYPLAANLWLSRFRNR